MEEAVRLVQEKCLADMFRVSMDRKTYAPWQVRAPPWHAEPAGRTGGWFVLDALPQASRWRRRYEWHGRPVARSNSGQPTKGYTGVGSYYLYTELENPGR